MLNAPCTPEVGWSKLYILYLYLNVPFYDYVSHSVN